MASQLRLTRGHLPLSTWLRNRRGAASWGSTTPLARHWRDTDNGPRLVLDEKHAKNAASVTAGRPAARKTWRYTGARCACASLSNSTAASRLRWREWTRREVGYSRRSPLALRDRSIDRSFESFCLSRCVRYHREPLNPRNCLRFFLSWQGDVARHATSKARVHGFCIVAARFTFMLRKGVRKGESTPRHLTTEYINLPHPSHSLFLSVLTFSLAFFYSTFSLN